jgi:hypothetical protein
MDRNVLKAHLRERFESTMEAALQAVRQIVVLPDSDGTVRAGADR